MSSRPMILASSSPRRWALMQMCGWPFEVRPAELAEVPHPGEAPYDFVRRMSQAKARAAAREVPPGALVIAADTVVSLDGRILGKPADSEHAGQMLRQLRGRTHEVYTGLTALDTAAGDDGSRPRLHTEVVCSRVPMRDFGDEELEAYVATGDPLDKAGAYAIQHAGFQPVDRPRLTDCFTNVMGLPLCEVVRLLRRFGIEPQTPVAEVCRQALDYDCQVLADLMLPTPGTDEPEDRSIVCDLSRWAARAKLR